MSLTSTFARRFLAPGIVMGLVLAAVLAGCGTAASTTTPPAPTATTAPVATTAPTATSVPPTPVSGNVAITIQNFAFNPQTITVKVGSTITWTDKDSIGHTVTSLTGPTSFNSGILSAPGGTFKFTFTKAGTYTYHCMVHPSMTGTITVVS